MSPSQNQFSVVALIQVLECELGRKSQTSDPTGIYGVYFASRRKVLEEIVAKLRQVSRGEDSVIFWMNFGSALITRIEKRTAYSRRPLAPAVRASVFGELSGLRVALGIFRKLLKEKPCKI